MGLKYYIQYKSLNANETWRVEINDPSYSDTPMERIGVNPDTCNIEWQGTDSIFEKWVIGSSATIQMYFNEESEVEELMSVQDRSWLVEVKREGVLFWKGYLISDGISLPDSGVTYPITLTATDGLEASDGIPFTNSIANLPAITTNSILGGVRCPINWLRNILMDSNHLKLEMPIRWFCTKKNINLASNDFFSGNTVLFNYGDVWTVDKGLTDKWILEGIAKSSTTRLFQYDGYWNVIDISDLAYFDGVINGYELSSRLDNTSSTWTADVNENLGTKINENTFTLIKKPVSEFISKYEQIQSENIIPNGSFDTVFSGGVLYWGRTSGTALVTYAQPPLNGRDGYSVEINNVGISTQSIFTFGADSVYSMPLDSNILFETCTWGFTFAMHSSNGSSSGTVNWTNNPLRARVKYTGYQNGVFREFFLNEFGYWVPISSSGSLVVTAVTDVDTYPIITFSGTADIGQTFQISFRHGEVDEYYTHLVTFTSSLSTTASIDYIATQIPNAVRLTSNTLGIGFLATSPITAYTTPAVPAGDEYIPFTVDSLNYDDIATVQFQSKGNQGRVLFPDCGTLDADRAIGTGKLSLEFIIPPNVAYSLDDVYMDVESNNDVYRNYLVGVNNAKEEDTLNVSSSFSGFMLSSYMNSFSTSDLSMVFSDGTDLGRLTDLYGKIAIRMLNTPCKIIDTEVVGIKSMLSLLEYNNSKYIVNKLTINTEQNSSKMTIFELKYNDTLNINTEHYGGNNRS